MSISTDYLENCNKSFKVAASFSLRFLATQAKACGYRPLSLDLNLSIFFLGLEIILDLSLLLSPLMIFTWFCDTPKYFARNFIRCSFALPSVGAAVIAIFRRLLCSPMKAFLFALVCICASNNKLLLFQV